MMLEEIRYRNGFLFTQEHSIEAKTPSGWNMISPAGARLFYHPSAKVTARTNASSTVVLIGHCFNPKAAHFGSSEIAESILKVASQRLQLLNLLDELAGRFALLVCNNCTWEIFHDAIGSRSVFYHKSERVISSHAGLIADCLGLRYGDYFIPFLTSKNYQEKDVKYLPGNWTPFDEIRQLTPNTSITTLRMEVRRYWPREQLSSTSSINEAAEQLTEHLAALKHFLKDQESHVFMGLTGGNDSRGLYAALHDLKPELFTWVRSKDGTQSKSEDSEAAKAIADLYGQNVHIWQLSSPRLNVVGDNLSVAFREATACYRGPTSAWLKPMVALNKDYDNSIFVRGFGGEILRGFYQDSSHRIREGSAAELSRTYDINGGSDLTRTAFSEFIDTTSFDREFFLGRDVNDMFYWEHRMGTWGSVAMSEADIAIIGITGYNSRLLFDTFLGMDYELRKSREATALSAHSLAPGLQQIPVV
ncbi:hypothetical protein [Ponticaulis profundi]|uniref:Asparagine synthetase domain-containing protein n=1 Tax=Ponticaulis profundi TaxID=2665222 RepID=A0ABW1SCH3_9PROT